MINLITEERIQIWVKLKSDGDMFYLKELDVEQLGQNYPKWWTHDIMENGLDFATGLIIAEDQIEFMMMYAIAPSQPFLLEFRYPTYNQYWTDWGYEYDAEYHWDVVQVKPISTRRAEALWASFLTRRKELRNARNSDSIPPDVLE